VSTPLVYSWKRHVFIAWDVAAVRPWYVYALTVTKVGLSACLPALPIDTPDLPAFASTCRQACGYDPAVEL